MQANELREKSAIELRDLNIALIRELFNLRMQKSLGQLAKPHQIKNIKRDIARVKTVYAEKVSNNE